MRILVLTNMYPPHHYGGYELQCRDVVEQWRSAGHEVTVLTTTWRIPGREDDPDQGSGVRRELEFWWEDHRVVHPSPWRRFAIERRSHRTVHRVLDEVRPDVVSAWAMGCMSLGLLTAVARRGMPVVQVVCDDWMIYGPRVDAWSRPFASRPRLSRVVGAVTGLPTSLEGLGRIGPACFVSEVTRQRALAGAPWPPLESTVVPSGIDAATFATDGSLAPDRPWQNRLLCVGRIDERKGLDTAIRALPLLPDHHLEILGRGDDEHLGELRCLAADLGVSDRVCFDWVSREALPERYRAADAFIFPVRWDEPFGLVPIEAMACGTPVIATATGGSSEFLHDGVNCVRVAVGDHRAIAEAVRAVRDDRRLRGRLISAGRRTADALTVDRCGDALLAWHRAAAEPGTPRPEPLPSIAELLDR